MTILLNKNLLSSVKGRPNYKCANIGMRSDNLENFAILREYNLAVKTLPDFFSSFLYNRQDFVTEYFTFSFAF